MRLNVGNYRSILSKNGLTDGQVCKSTGLSEKTLLWILENQYIDVSTLELIADTLRVAPKEIALPDHDGCSENVIEWTKDQGDTRTFPEADNYQGKKVSRKIPGRMTGCSLEPERQHMRPCPGILD